MNWMANTHKRPFIQLGVIFTVITATRSFLGYNVLPLNIVIILHYITPEQIN